MIFYLLFLVFIGLIVLLIVVLCFYFYYKMVDYNCFVSNVVKKFLRRLGFYEKFFLISVKVNNIGYINMVLFLEFKVKFD